MNAITAWLPWVIGMIITVVAITLVIKGIGITFIRSDQIGLVEKIWSRSGSPKEGAILSMNGEAGFQPEILRAGLHFKPRFIYKVHFMDLVTIGAGTIGYIMSRDGEALKAEQSLGKSLLVETYEDVRKFLEQGGNRGRQRTILREGTYAINPVMFIVLSETDDYYFDMGDEDAINKFRTEIEAVDGFKPVIFQGPKQSDHQNPDELDPSDQCGIVTVHDGPSLPDGELIAPPVGGAKGDPDFHNNFQDPEAFLRAGGYRGLQYPVLTDGTYYINRLFATVERVPKTLVKVGEAMVVNSFFGPKGADSSGDDFTHGELVEVGQRGIWKDALLPGKYAFNVRAGILKPVPTTNIILKWIAAERGLHGYDDNLAEVGLITKDAFEPLLPLQVVIHIDYKMAPRVIQRFGDIKVLVNQSLDPLVSSYFKNIAQKKTVIELIQQRGDIQAASTTDMKARFAEYDLELAEVLIGTPRSSEGDKRIEEILTQLRDRQVAAEKETTFDAQKKAAQKERELKEAEATAAQQTALTESSIKIQVEENAGKAEATRAKQEAEKVKTIAAADAERVRLNAQAEADKVKLSADADAERIEKTKSAEAAGISALADAEAKRAREVGLAEAQAQEKLIAAFSGEGAALKVQQAVGLAIADAIQMTGQRLTPDQVVNFGGSGEGGAPNLVEALLTMAMADKIGTPITLGRTSETEPVPDDPDHVVVPMPQTAEESTEPETAEEPMPVAAGAEAEVIPTTEEAPKPEKGHKPRTPGRTKQQQ